MEKHMFFLFQNSKSKDHEISSLKERVSVIENLFHQNNQEHIVKELELQSRIAEIEQELRQSVEKIHFLEEKTKENELNKESQCTKLVYPLPVSFLPFLSHQKLYSYAWIEITASYRCGGGIFQSIFLNIIRHLERTCF